MVDGGTVEMPLLSQVRPPQGPASDELISASLADLGSQGNAHLPTAASNEKNKALSTLSIEE
jgi:hypothetical protein